MVAAENDDVTCMQILLQANADTTVKDKVSAVEVAYMR